MGVNNFQDYKVLLIHCSITCMHFAGILLFVHFNEPFYSIGSYKYMVLIASIFVSDLLKLSLTSSQLDYLAVGKQDLSHVPKSKKSNKTFKNIFKFVAASIGITIFYYIIVILFGAPLFTECEKTLLLAFTLSMLTLVPASLHLGIDNTLALFIGYPMQVNGAFVDSIKLNIKTVLFGTWISAFVYPLDWDRPWQVWPIPCLVGALLGYFTAHFLTFVSVSTLKLKKKTRRSMQKNC